MGFLQEARRRNALLFFLSAAFTALFLLFLLAYYFCGSIPIADVCYWLKPFKFSISFAIYTLTVGWLMEYLKPLWGKNTITLVSIIFATLIMVEMGVIALNSMQDSFGFEDQEIDANLKFVGNVAIIGSSLVVLLIGVFFFGPISVKPDAYLWGIRMGIIVFLLSCLLGVFLRQYFAPSTPTAFHFGFPFTQFSTPRSNLLSLHFFGIHALQLFPLMGWFLNKKLAYALIFTLSFIFVAGTLFFIALLYI